ncbi:ectoine hydroxylase [Streptoverticillium reticulum]|uniref:ectoine hydroxylase n=1 Tax=Streptoverticillium reticulum TaxID=1433415 RepID=UPI0039BFF521
MTDRYPTRTSRAPELLAREDPVCWGEPGGGPLGEEDLAVYAATGFHCAERLLTDDEVAQCNAELTRLAGDPRLLHDDRLVREGGTGEVRSVFEVHRLSEPVARVLAAPKVVGLACQILGSEVYVHQSRINYKPGFGGGPFYWHSDFETWHAEDGLAAPRALSVCLALAPNHPHNGALMIMPGSHLTFVTCRGSTPPGHFRRSLSSHDPEIGTPDRASLTTLADRHGIRMITGPAGSATVFDSNCMHGSNGNITPFPRANLFVVFNSVDNAPGKPFAAPGRRPSFIAARDITPFGR